ncbi:hypothetical protein D3C87_2136720 [compost metagenome]
MRSKVEAILAERVGDIRPGRIATRNFSRSVTGIKEDAVTHASSQDLPVGSNTPP